MNDRELQQIVIEELRREPSIDAAHISVTAKDGVVTLTGFVATYAEKAAAEQTVRRIKGVRAIAEELEVRLPAMEKHADDEIARRALDILAWNASLPEARIKVEVEHGIVTLTGEVDWQYQKARAEADLRFLGGVIGVVNALTVRPSLKPELVRDKIKSALERVAALEAAEIDVHIEGSKVTLDGWVHSWAERSAAERAAWSTPGVSQVVDHLSIRV